MMTDNQDRQAQVERQRQRFLEIYQPQTSREAMIIDELARVCQEKEEFERDHKLWMQHESNTALQTIQRQEADDFLKLRRQWPKAPAAVAPLIGQSINGALWLVEFWQMLVARLNPKSIGPAPGMDQACQTLLVMGFAEKIQGLSEPGWWWATRFLAIQADKDEAIKAWLRKSGTCDRTTETQQARYKLYDAPDASIARQELYDEATRQLATWQAKLKQLKEAEPALRQAQLAQARCMGLKTPGLATCLNNAFRLRDAILRGIKFFEDRLARAQNESGAKERENRHKTIPNQKLQNLDPPSDPLEEAIRTDLLPRMAAASAQPPANRPMSNRKKQLARMAAREEKARQAAVPQVAMA